MSAPYNDKVDRLLKFQHLKPIFGSFQRDRNADFESSFAKSYEHDKEMFDREMEIVEELKKDKFYYFNQIDHKCWKEEEEEEGRNYYAFYNSIGKAFNYSAGTATSDPSLSKKKLLNGFPKTLLTF